MCHWRLPFQDTEATRKTPTKPFTSVKSSAEELQTVTSSWSWVKVTWERDLGAFGHWNFPKSHDGLWFSFILLSWLTALTLYREKILLMILTENPGVPGWLSPLSIWLLVSVQVMISWFCEFEPHDWLCADSAEPAWDSLSPSLSAHPPLLPFSLSLSLSLSFSLKINKL